MAGRRVPQPDDHHVVVPRLVRLRQDRTVTNRASRHSFGWLERTRFCWRNQAKHERVHREIEIIATARISEYLLRLARADPARRPLWPTMNENSPT